MERRDFLKFALGTVGAAAFAASAQAAPLMPQPLNENDGLPANPGAQPAVTSKEETDRLAPEEVRWHRGRRWGWHRRRHPGRRRHWRRW